MSIATVSAMPNVAAMAKAAETREVPGQPDHDGDADDEGAKVSPAAALQSAKSAGVGTVLDKTA